MDNTAIEKRVPAPLKERAQYALAFGVIALLLYIAGFPLFLLFFVGVLTFFIWKVFSSERRGDTRRIFEFYLSANEILRDDDRRWYGFELQEAVSKGESVVRSMPAAPPLVHFALGALYRKLGDHSAAVRHLATVVEGTSADEASIVYPTQELREYVRTLRKIERAPAEAPLTSAAIRSLERARRNKAPSMLESSRASLAEEPKQLAAEGPARPDSVIDLASYRETDEADAAAPAEADGPEAKRRVAGRQSISEVLHDIYDARDA